MLCGLSVVFAFCFVWGRVFCNKCVCVCDSFVMYCVMVRKLRLCVLSLCVRVLSMCVLFVYDCVVLRGFLCVRCVCVRVSMCLCVSFVACCAMLYRLPLMRVVLCSCVLLEMCRLCV